MHSSLNYEQNKARGKVEKKYFHSWKKMFFDKVKFEQKSEGNEGVNHADLGEHCSVIEAVRLAKIGARRFLRHSS